MGANVTEEGGGDASTGVPTPGQEAAQPAAPTPATKPEEKNN